MVKIAPFKGYIFNKEKITTLDMVMSPPYDIISEDLQQQLYNKHPNNFVRLILGKQYPDDTEENNRYTRAQQFFHQWQQENILVQSEKPALYPYKIDYCVGNKKKAMKGFFTLLKIDPTYKTVKAHEHTLSKPKADRLNLMRACQGNLEPIQLLYMDKDHELQKIFDTALNSPMISVQGYDGFSHHLWKLDTPSVISKATSFLQDKILFIADGHHRYQTAINFAEEQKKITGNVDADAPFNYRLVILVNMFDEGLDIFPTHRLIKMPSFNLGSYLKKAEEFFTVEKKSVQSSPQSFDTIGKQILEDISTSSGHKFALYSKGAYYVLTLKDETIMDRLIPDRSKTWRTLDVSILHIILLERLLGINQSNLEDHVKYTRVDAEAIEFVDTGKFDISFLMNATKIEELKEIADADEHMPQKSTYFLPKMLSGLVMYKFD